LRYTKLKFNDKHLKLHNVYQVQYNLRRPNNAMFIIVGHCSLLLDTVHYCWTLFIIVGHCNQMR